MKTNHGDGRTPRLSRVLVVALAILTTTAPGARAQDALELISPDERNVVTLGVVDGALVYALERDGLKVLLPSRLGFEFRGAPPLSEGLEITGSERHASDQVWEQPWGEVALVRDLHNELRVSVAETGDPGRQFVVVFRAFDDGVAFRYELPEQPGLGEFEIMDELTEFHLADDPKAWWIPANDPTHRYELLYRS